MKNKRLLAILVTFVVVGTLAILGGAVFTVKSISIDFKNEFYFFRGQESELKSELIDSVSRFTRGKNILFSVNRQKIIDTIETEQWRLRVTNIEAKFPDKLEIRVRERYPVFKYSEGGREAWLDGSLRILDIDNTNLPPQWELIDISNVVNADSFDTRQVGDWISEGEEKTEKIKVLEFLAPFYARISTFEDAFCSIFEKVEFEGTELGYKLRLTSRPPADSSPNTNKFEIVIEEASIEGLEAKLTKAWQALEHNSNKPGLYLVTPYEDNEIRVIYKS